MKGVSRYLPFLDLRHYRRSFLGSDLAGAIAVTFLAVPQGMAYAIIAGLPPKMGLYAAAIPAVIGSLTRSSRQVVSGPTNALSLLVGLSLAAKTDDPVVAASLLALLVGVFQVLGGVLRLGVIVDYLSRPVVIGYITGAGVLIGVGQLPSAIGVKPTPTEPACLLGDHLCLPERFLFLGEWVRSIPQAHLVTTAVAVSTVALILLVRRLHPRLPSAIIAIGSVTLVSLLLRLEARGLRVVADLAPIPRDIPLAIPQLDGIVELLGLAVACTVLSLVESSAVGRSIAARTGQDLDMSAEFVGQGLANLAAGFSGAYPVSGSLSRSALNAGAGAKSRLSGVASGLFLVVVILALAPALGRVPMASLAGLLLVVAVELVDVPLIRTVLRSTLSDALALLATMLGTWVLELDQAIYLGVGISLLLFLRKARILAARELVVDTTGRLRERPTEDDGVSPATPERSCAAIRVLHLEGNLFFAAANELRAALEHASADPEVQVIVLRLKRTQGMDVTVAGLLDDMARRLRGEGKTLILVGMRAYVMRILERTRVAASIGGDNLFPARAGWFEATDAGLKRALAIVGDHSCAPCPFSEVNHGQVGRPQGNLEVTRASPP